MPFPRPVSQLRGLHAEAVACGAHHSLVLTASGAYTFGDCRRGQLGLGSRLKPQPNPRRVPLEEHWSEEYRGAAAVRGQGATAMATASLPPDFVPAADPLAQPSREPTSAPTSASVRVGWRGGAPSGGLAGGLVRAIAAGGQHSLLIDRSGCVYASGAGDSGQLGTGLDADEPSPRAVTSLVGMAVVMAACGEAHSVILSSCARVFACGRNESGPRLGWNPPALAPHVTLMLTRPGPPCDPHAHSPWALT